MLRRFGGVGSDLFSTTFQKVLTEAQEPDYYDEFNTEPLGNGAPAAIELLHALSQSEDDDLKDFFATLENSLKDEMWTMTDEQLQEVLKVIAPYLVHKNLQFLGEIPLKKLSRVPPNLLGVLMKDVKVIQMASITIQRQAAEANIQYFKAIMKDPLQLVLKGESPKERMEGFKQMADIIGDSEAIFRSFSNLCSAQYSQSKAFRWASTYRDTVMKVKSNQMDIPRFRDLFDLASEVSNCMRKKEISPGSFMTIRKQLEKLIHQQANAEERDYRQRVEEFNKKHGFTEGIKDQLLALWRQLKSKDTYNIFADPVTEAIAPGYFALIKRPMDLSTIQSKINKGLYQSKEDMSNDVLLMLQNCISYNKGTTWAVYATNIRAQWDYISKNVGKNGAVAAKTAKSVAVDVHPTKVIGRAREVAKQKAVAKAVKKKTRRNDSDDSAEENGDDDDDDDESVIAQGRSMLKPNKSAASDDDSYVGPASRQRPERSAKKRRIVEDSSDEEGVGTRFVNNNDGNSSDEEEFQPRTPLEKKLLKLWNFVDRNDPRHMFLNRVTDEMAPNYSQVVRSPMFLNLIKSKLSKGEYSDVSLFNKDMDLIFSNCIFYNGDTSDLGKFAAQLREKYRKFLSKEESSTPKAAVTDSATGSSSLTSSRMPKSSGVESQSKFKSNASHDRLKSILTLLWKKLVDLDSFAYFLNEVSDDIAPGYSEEIEHPMHLTLMKKKISRGDYKSVEEFHKDVNLIVDNCVKYNGDDSDFATTAFEFRDSYFNFLNNNSSIQEQLAAICNGTAGEPPVLSRQVSSSTDSLQDLLLDVWSQVVAMDNKGIFMEKVTNSMAAGYSTKIRRPMYLSLMKDKILKCDYRRVEDFSSDIKLIVDNCKNYNGPDSPFSTYAKEFHASYLALVKTLPKTSTLAAPVSSVRTGATTTSNAPPKAAAPAVLEETDESLMQRIKAGWLFLHEKDTYKLFLEPVTDAIAPGYSKKIKRPMCLNDMKIKAKNKQYANFAAFVDDVQVMFANCATFNGKDSEVAVYGQEIWKGFEQHVAKIKPQYKKSAPVVTPVVTNTEMATSGGSDLKTIKSCILESINTIRSADNLGIFEDKVSIPGYSRVVKKSMYVKMMEEKANNLAYRSFDDFCADVTLMLDNCNLFNKGNQQVINYAEGVRAAFDSTKAELMNSKLRVAPPTAPSAPAVQKTVTPAVIESTKTFPVRPDIVSSVTVDSQQLLNLQERLKRETYVPLAQIYATAQRAAHSRQFTVPEMRYLHKFFVETILSPMQEYSSLVPIDSADEAMIIKTYIPQNNVNKLKSLRPESAMFGTNLSKLNEVLSAAIEFLVKIDGPAKYFREVPTDAIAPDYSKLIQYPMAISILREKVKYNAYQSIDDFYEDVLYIAKNCLDYNGFDSVLAKAVVDFVVRWHVYYGFMLHFYSFLCSKNSSRSMMKSPGADSSSGPSPSVIPKKRRTMSSDDESEANNGKKSKDSNKHDSVSPPAKKAKPAEVAPSPPPYLTEIDAMVDAAALGKMVDGSSLSFSLTVPEEEWKKFVDKLLNKKTAASGQKTSVILSKLTEIVVQFLRGQDARKLFTRPLPQAKEVDKSELMDFATMMVKVDRNMYSSCDEVAKDLRKLPRNRLITERFNAQDNLNTNDFSRYALEMFYIMQSTFHVLEKVLNNSIVSSSDAMPLIPSVTTQVPPAPLGPAKSEDVGISIETKSSLPSPPKIKRQVSEDGEVLSDDECPAKDTTVMQVNNNEVVVTSEPPLPEPRNVATSAEEKESMRENIEMKVDEASTAETIPSEPVEEMIADKKIMQMDVDDEVKEEFVPTVPTAEEDMKDLNVVKDNLTTKGLLPSDKKLFETEEFESDEEFDATKTNTKLIIPTAPAAPSIPRKVKLNDATSLFQTDEFDSEEEADEALPSAAPAPLPPVSTVAPTIKHAPTVAAVTPKMPAIRAKPAKKQSLGSLFETDAFDSSDESDNDEDKPDEGAFQPVAVQRPVPIADHTQRIKKKIRMDSDDEDDNTVKPIAHSFKPKEESLPPKHPTLAKSSSSKPVASHIAVTANATAASESQRSTPATLNEGNLLRPIQSTADFQAVASSNSSSGSNRPTSTSTGNTPAPPQPSEVLLSSRRAVEYMQRLSSVLKQHMQGQQEGFRSSETNFQEAILSLPGLATTTALRWAVLILKAVAFQQMLLPHLASEIVLALLAAKDERSALLYKHQRVLFFTQLVCFSITNDLQLYGLEGEKDDRGLVATLLREWVPMLLCSVLDKNVPESSEERLVENFFTTTGTVVKEEPGNVGSATTRDAPAVPTTTTASAVDKDKTIKLLKDLRAQLVLAWSEKMRRLEL
jgi:hypothetical protein